MLSDDVVGALDAIASALDTLDGLDHEVVEAADVLGLAQRCETLDRRLTVIRHDLAHQVRHRDVAEVGGPAVNVLANWLRITPAEARRRMRTVEPLVATTTLTGQTLLPRQPGTAAAWRAGQLDEDHVRVIGRFLTELPGSVPAAEWDNAEAFLAEQATQLRPDQLKKLADKLALSLNPDGTYSDEDRARRRSFTWGPQDPDGMSQARFWATPELRACLDAVFAKFAAPGMANPADQAPVISGTPSEAAITSDFRTCGQRQHDALTLLVRSQLGNPALGQHNGLPVTVIATATVHDLQNKTGYATTGGGTWLPITDLIRMASHAYHYLALFDGVTSRPLYLGRTKRVATADQRLILHATDRGCSHPGCTIPGYLTEVHHVESWVTGGLTNIDNLTFACGPHHRLLKPGGWTTRKTTLGQTQWIPPPGSPMPNSLPAGGTNRYHHPERLLSRDDSGDGGDAAA